MRLMRNINLMDSGYSRNKNIVAKVIGTIKIGFHFEDIAITIEYLSVRNLY